MALVVSVLEASLINAFKANVPDATSDQTSQINAMATAMATAIDAYIKTATVIGTCVNAAGAGTTLSTVIT